MVYLVNDLEALGLRRADPRSEDDGRAKAGAAHRARPGSAPHAGRAALVEIETEWRAALGQERLEQLRELLLELRAFLWPPES